MKTLIIAILNYIANAHRSKSGVSSKRLYGGIGFLCSVVFIAIWQHELINELLYVSASMIGLETVTRMFGKKNDTTPKE